MWATAGLLGALGAVGYYTWVHEPSRIIQRHYTVAIPSDTVRQMTLLHLSDFHFFAGMEARRDFLHKLAQTPTDLLFLTGDFIDYDSGIDLCLDALAPFQVRHGAFAVLGNHDFCWLSPRDMLHSTGHIPPEKRKPNDIARLVAGLENLGVAVLRNRRTDIACDDLTLTIAGVDDPYLGNDDIPKTFDGYTPRHPCLMLAHAPERYEELAEIGVNMVFSGHTHGGQVRIPGIGPLITRTGAPRSFADGFTCYKDTLFYTTRGMGSSKITRPRLFCPPEVTWFTLRFSPDVKKATRLG